MPARGSFARRGAYASSAFCSVRSGLPAPGCTTSPAGLLTTMTSSSSQAIDERRAPARRPGRRPHRARRARRARRPRRCRAAAARGRRRAACRVDAALEARARELRQGSASAWSRRRAGRLRRQAAVRVGVGWNSCGSGAVFVRYTASDSTAGVQSFAASQNDGAHPPDRVRCRRSRGLRLQGARGRTIAARTAVREGARAADGRRLSRRRALLRGARGALPVQQQARQGRLDIIYAYYRAREQESAVDAADQFIRENPTHPRVDYAMYLGASSTSSARRISSSAGSTPT